MSDSTVRRYRPPRQPSQNWRAFLENHLGDIVAMDFFVVPTATFRVLYVLLIVAHDRRRILHFNVTTSPSADWTARQLLRVLRSYASYYHASRIHRALDGDSPDGRAVEPPEQGDVIAYPQVSGLTADTPGAQPGSRGWPSHPSPAPRLRT